MADTGWAAARRLAAVLMILALAGCATMRGAPEPVLQALKCPDPAPPPARTPATPVAHGCDATLNALLRTGVQKEERNLYIERGIVTVNDAYAVYIRHLRNERVASGLTAGLLDLSAEVAATLTDSVGVKENWNALGLLVNGTYGIVNEQAFMEKTVGALIESMNAARVQVRLRLFEGMRKSMLEYPLAAAQTDLQEYASAGTLEGGVTYAQTVAKNAAEDVQRRIDGADPIPDLSDLEMSAKRCVSLALTPTNPGRATYAQLSAAYAALTHVATPASITEDDLRDALDERNNDLDGAAAIEVRNALQGAGAIPANCK